MPEEQLKLWTPADEARWVTERDAELTAEYERIQANTLPVQRYEWEKQREREQALLNSLSYAAWAFSRYASHLPNCKWETPKGCACGFKQTSRAIKERTKGLHEC